MVRETAELLYEYKRCLDSGDIVDIRIWWVPKPVLGSLHPFKYSLFYGRPGIRLVCYDNERGKGDHKHLNGVETPYNFTNVDQLIADFRSDISPFMTIT